LLQQYILYSASNRQTNIEYAMQFISGWWSQSDDIASIPANNQQANRYENIVLSYQGGQ
jgi:hypothetical protein